MPEEHRLIVDNTEKQHEIEEAMNDEDLKFLQKLGSENDTETTNIFTSHETKIQHVPNVLREDNLLRYYEPRVIAIGPIHHANANIMLKEDLKLNMAAKFVKDSGKKREDLLIQIKKNIKELRTRFTEEALQGYDDEKLARMLFLDGSTVLEFVHCYVRKELKQYKINKSTAVMIRQDLLLLENQIPYTVLTILMGKNSVYVASVRRFILMNGMAPPRENDSMYLKACIEEKQPVHLLDLLRLATFHLDRDRDSTSGGLRGRKKERQRTRDPDSFYRWSFRNVQDLKAVGIKLRPSKSLNLGAISFSARLLVFGQIKIPPLIVDDSTSRKLFNLVAYEMCPDNMKTGLGVTSYLSFLDSLIDNEHDVKYLRKAHILRNRLSSDAEVAKLFNTLGNNLVPNGDAFVDLKNEIQKYCDRRLARWKAKLYREHLRSPWTIIALLAAGIALFLTGVSAWFSAFPKKNQN